MNNTDITNLIAGLLNRLNIVDVCLCPGARNSPLINAFSKTDIHMHSILDERSAGFYSLGLAKATGKPVAISCTSGTALANLFPAIIEARMSEVPLVIITADRPKELVDKGENQTIYQNNIYGRYVCDYIDIDPLKDGKKSIIEKINMIINASLGVKEQKPLSEKGPVHINIHFDEPLIPSESELNLADFNIHPIKSSDSDIDNLDMNMPIKKPLIICGQSDLTDKKEQIIDIAQKIGAPILADISSNIKLDNHIISFYDHFIDAMPTSDIIIRFGKKPVSKQLLSLINNKKTYLISDRSRFNDDASNMIRMSLAHLRDNINTKKESDWLHSFIEKNNTIKDMISNRLNKKNIHEYNFAYELIEKIPDQSSLFIGNSLMIRAFDSFTDRNTKDIRIFSNRGASGIDGNLSTASGIANSSVENNYLVIGDQSFMHDIGSLQLLTAKNINLTIFIINNYGGAIFDHLPLSDIIDQSIFEKFIRCQHSYNFRKIIESYDLNYNEIHSIEDLTNIDLELSGVNINEVFINTEESERFLQEFSN